MSDIYETLVRSALLAIGFSPVEEGGDSDSFEIPESLRDSLQAEGLADGKVVSLKEGTPAPLADWLFNHAFQEGIALHGAPKRQPGSVHELTDTLFKPYAIEGGSMHLGGCVLEDRPLLLLSVVSENQGESRSDSRQTLFLHPDGQPLDEDLTHALDLIHVVPFMGRPPRLEKELHSRFRQQAEQSILAAHPDAPLQIEAMLIVWCKYASGKMVIAINDSTTEIPFSGWAQLLASGAQKPPPLMCPESALQSYRIGSTDDGKITVVEALGQCSVSGKNGLAVEMEPCSITGKLALPELMTTEPLTGSPVIPSAMGECSMCSQAVPPASIRSGRCTACRALKNIDKSDPRMARVLGEYPGLDVWRKWKLSESNRDYLLMASTLWRRLFIVLDKSTLEIYHAATSGRFGHHFSALAHREHEELFER